MCEGRDTFVFIYCQENCSICSLGLSFEESQEVSTKVKDYLSNYKCKYHLTKKKKSTSRKLFYRYTHMRAGLFMTAFCCSKRLETIHMPIKWRWLNVNYGTFIQGMIMQS